MPPGCFRKLGIVHDRDGHRQTETRKLEIVRRHGQIHRRETLHHFHIQRFEFGTHGRVKRPTIDDLIPGRQPYRPGSHKQRHTAPRTHTMEDSTIKWTDDTTYTRQDTARVPTAWKYNTGMVRIYLTCGHSHHPPGNGSSFAVTLGSTRSR